MSSIDRILKGSYRPRTLWRYFFDLRLFAGLLSTGALLKVFFYRKYFLTEIFWRCSIESEPFKYLLLTEDHIIVFVSLKTFWISLFTDDEGLMIFYRHRTFKRTAPDRKLLQLLFYRGPFEDLLLTEDVIFWPIIFWKGFIDRSPFDCLLSSQEL